jgi:hypothetical protein
MASSAYPLVNSTFTSGRRRQISASASSPFFFVDNGYAVFELKPEVPDKGWGEPDQPDPTLLDLSYSAVTSFLQWS